jgi:hypothetical protein
MSEGPMRNPSAAWWLVPISGLLLFWLLNLVMPLNADDFANSVFLEDGKPKIITSFSQLMQQVQRDFLSHNARLGQIYYLFSLIFLPKWLNDLIVTVWVGYLMFLLIHIALRRNIQPSGFDMTLWLGILSVIFLPLQAVENFISYTCGLYNYIPGGVGTLLVLDKISRWFIEGEDNAPKWWLYLVAFLAGWSHEVYGFFMVPLFTLLAVWRIVMEKEFLASVPSWVWYLMGSFTLGFGVLALAPGTQGRASIQPAYSFFASLIMASVSYVGYALLAVPFCVGIVLLLLLFIHKEDLLPKREKVFFALLLISTMGTIFFSAAAGFILYGRALWGIHLVLGIILVWGVSHFMYRKIWLVTVPVVLGALLLFGTLIWNTYVVRAEFEHIVQAFINAGKRGDAVLLVDFPELRKEPHSTIMRSINRVLLVQRDPKHWLNTGLVRYYNALYAGKEGFKGPAYIILDNLVPPYLNRYSYDTKNDPLNHYPEIQSLIERQKARNKGEDGHL